MNEVVRALVAEAERTNERRAVVIHGDRKGCYAAVRRALDDAGIPGTETTCLTEGDIGPAEHLRPVRSADLLGRTRRAVVVDCHDECRPNALGRAAGAVDGGGLLFVLAPPLSTWPERRDGFDERLAVPPFSIEDVRGRFRRRLVETIRAHRGVAVYDADADWWESDGLTDPAPRLPTEGPTVPDDAVFPRAAYEACITTDQAEAVQALEALREAGTAVVLEADRGRGKSAAAGLAAGALAAEGRDVLVTAPSYRNAAEVFDRAAALLDARDALADRPDGTHPVSAAGGGRVRYAAPPDAAGAAPDALVVDEAAAVPVRLLREFATGETPVAFATTVHGYEGSGRGFDVRFRGWLADSDRSVTEYALSEPIRYAAGDPVEVWLFRALLLDAAPPVAPLVADATPETARYVACHPEALVADDHLLRAVFGLLVAAHYRTEPDDLARLLDAPNVSVRALTHDGRVVAVAMLAWEGDLPPALREQIYEGEGVRGNMLPEVLTAQLRDIDAGASRGLRVVRIAVHDAVRSRGLGTALLDEIASEFGEGDGAPSGHGFDEHGRDALTARHAASDGPVDYLGVGFGATPRLLRFWRRAGYRTVHLSTTRNDASGEHSALLVRPVTDAGEALLARNGAWFRRQIPALLSDALRDCKPGVVVGALRATDGAFSLDLTEREWRAVAAAAYGDGYYGSAPRPFRHLVARGVADGVVDGERAELLVARALQARPWADLADSFGYVSERQCVRGFVDALDPLVEAYGGEAAREEAARYR
jgi:tRNA(Met) cytidine acetyltransferase